MAPTNSKANYKSYEAQARMVRAIVAAHPEVKWNYKEIATCYGSDMTEHALNHRFRKIRAQAVVISKGRSEGFDMKYMSVDENILPSTKEAVEKQNIAKFFGQSTADGIQFQFRTIKKDAEMLRSVESSGGDPASCLTLSTMTPTKSSRGGGGGGSSRKRARNAKISDDDGEGEGDDSDDDNGGEENWSDRDKDETPSKRTKKGTVRGQRNGTPSRRAAVKASATIAQLGKEDDNTTTAAAELPQAKSSFKSIFGDVKKEPLQTNGQIIDPKSLSPLNNLSTDPYMPSSFNDSFYQHSEDLGYGDGEI